MTKIIYLDLFSGIGGFALGLNKAGIEFEKHYFSEIDKYAIDIYEKHFPNAMSLGDINGVDTAKIERPDIITFGFPCQDISVCGAGEGLAGQRSSLFFKAIEIVDRTHPKYFILENVKGLFSSNKRRDFEEVLYSISSIGYDGQWQLLNTKWILPQNRERIYFVGYPRGGSRREIFPLSGRDFESKYQKETKLIELTTGESDAKRVYSIEGVAKTLKAIGGGLGAKTGLYQIGIVKQDKEIEERDISQTIDSNYWKGLDKHRQRTGVMTIDNKEYRIRRLTPVECERLQGFPDNYTKYGKSGKVISDTRRYMTIGNAVTVQLVKLIGEKIKNTGDEL